MSHTPQEKILIGLKIRQLRTEASWSFEDLSKRSGVSISYLNEIEKGKKYPGPSNLLKIATALRVKVPDLTSGSLSKQMAPIGALIESNFLDELPFELFGISTQQVVEIMARAPERVHAFISAMLEIARNYSVRQENFFLAALRAYQEMHMNYFPDLEAEAKLFMEKHDLSTPGAAKSERLEEVLFDEFGCEVDEEGLAAYPELSELRSVYIPKKKVLMLQPELIEAQRAFQIAKELGFQVLKLKKRPLASSLLRVRSFDQVWNNYKAAYFAVSLLVPERAFVNDLRKFFNLSTWQPDALLQLMHRYRIGPEVFFQRFNVLSNDFDLRKVFFLRIIHHTETGRFEIDKELHLNRRHTPHSNGLNEYYCRRWEAIRLLNELHVSGNDKRMKAGAARMKFAEGAETYLTISVAKVGLPNPKRQVSIMIGIEVDDLLKKHVSWWNDPALPSTQVGVTCDRCSVKDCAERMAEPTLLLKQQKRKTIEDALKKLTGHD
jgi:XRE family transcriptional regulator, fatty acid utilization regulator